MGRPGPPRGEREGLRLVARNPRRGAPATSESVRDHTARVRTHLRRLYPDHDVDALLRRVIAAIGIDVAAPWAPADPLSLFSESDTLLIAYGGSLVADDRPPLRALHDFLTGVVGSAVSGVHVLPFFPHSSDDGFAVIDYERVDPSLGGWDDIAALGDEFTLMADLVLNHVSARSQWFRQFRADQAPGNGFFHVLDPGTDTSAVVRPRTTPLLRPVETPAGRRHVWCTFSHDQVDLNFANPDVLLEFLRIIDRYLRVGVRMLRLDAVAYVWKRPGTPCIHLPETHELVRLLRSLLEWREPRALIVTETNVPNAENLTYFGNGSEAHLIYNFSLPPLIIDALLRGDSGHLVTWMMSMPPAPRGCAYLNFIGSHDGIGLRPAEDLIESSERDALVSAVTAAGGRVTPYAAIGDDRPYELNVALIDALAAPHAGPDRWQLERFICAHAIMLALEGVPAIYIHSLLATPNDLEAVERTGVNRAINRRRLHVAEVTDALEDLTSLPARVFDRLRRLIALRGAQPAFHPNATQYTLHLGDGVFGFWRQSLDRSQSIFALNNVTAAAQEVPLSQINLISTDSWRDLIAGRAIADRAGALVLAPYQSAWVTNRG